MEDYVRILSRREHLLASTLFCSALIAVSAASAAHAQGQPAAAKGEGEAVDELVVTGSRIARTNVVAATPVQVIGGDKLSQQGHNNIVDVLTTLPQFSAAFGASRTQSTFSGATSSGLNLVNLRNLGTQRSLVLINGRRVPAGNVQSTAVDFNTLPSANIERIEVITGGASAVYGADAVAGVVNIITKKHFNGLELGFGHGFAIKNEDNINPNAYVMVGHDIGSKGHFLATVQYDYQGLVRCADRYLCAQDFAWNYPGDPVRGPAAFSGVAPQGRFFINGPNKAFNGSFTRRDGSFSTTPTADNPNGVIGFVPSIDGYNRNGSRTLAIPTERIMGAFDVDYALTSNINAFLEVNYGLSKTRAPFEGHPFQSSSDLIGNAVEASIPGDNPFIPANLRAQYLAAGQTTPITWSQRFDQFGLRSAINERDTIRFSGGLKGNLDTLFGLGRDWKWEASYTYGQTKLDSISNGLVSKVNLYNGLRVEADPAKPGGYRCADPVARAQGCVPVNQFAPYTDAMKNYLTVNAGQRGEHTLEDAQAFLSGSIYELPAGPLQVAVGVESRRTTAFVDYDDQINRGIVTGNQIQDLKSTTFRTNEAYVETNVPVVKDLPFAKSINVEGAYRWSDGSTVGSYDTWKIGGDWSPIQSLRFRVMKAKSVRAPTLEDVAGLSQTFGVVVDPCTAANRNANATRAANCLADGIPANYSPVLQVQQSVGGFDGGNPALKPEESETLTYGLVFQAAGLENAPVWFRGLTVTLDRFEIDLNGAIASVGRQLTTNLCYDTAGAGRAQFCSQVQRGANPLVPQGPYALLAVNNQVQNLAEYNISGVDLEVSYSVALNDLFQNAPDLGKVSFNGIMTFYDKADEVPLKGQPKIDLLGFAGGSTSDQGWLKRQGNFTTKWFYKKFDVSWTARYIGETGMSPFVDGPKVPDYWYNDISARYQINDWASVYGGVNNIGDKAPPFFVSGASGTQALDTIPNYYDVFGRQIFMGVKLKFQ